MQEVPTDLVTVTGLACFLLNGRKKEVKNYNCGLDPETTNQLLCLISVCLLFCVSLSYVVATPDSPSLSREQRCSRRLGSEG